MSACLKFAKSQRKVVKPQRPAVPSLLYVLIAVMVSARLLLEQGCSHQALLGIGLVCLGGACLGVICFVRHGSVVVVAMIVASILASSFAAYIAYQGLLHSDESFTRIAPSRYEYVLTSDMQKGESSWKGTADVYQDGQLQGSVLLLTGREYDVGTHIQCIGRYRSYKEGEAGRKSWLQGIAGSVRVVKVVKAFESKGVRGEIYRLRKEILKTLEPAQSAGRALVAGCVCGYREAYRELKLQRPFMYCGLSHLVSVSGSHLALLALLLELILKRLFMRPLARNAVKLCATGCFVVLCGLPVSALRAWLLVVASCGSEAVGRRKNSLTSSCVIALVMVLLHPQTCESVSFLLSLCSVFGLMLYGSYIRYGVRLVTPRLPLPSGPAGFRKACNTLLKIEGDTIAASLTAQLVTLPVSIAVFGQFSLIAPLANALAVSFFSALVVLGFLVCATMKIPGVCAVVLGCIDIIGAAFYFIVQALAHIPVASVAVEAPSSLLWAVSCIVSALVLVWWPSIRPRVILVGTVCVVLSCACYFVRWRYFAPVRICVMDIGQGDAILVTDGASSMLIDTSPDEAVLDALQRQHVFHIDSVLLTHLDMDHVGGVDDLVGQIPCEEVIVAHGVNAHEQKWLKTAIMQLTGKASREVVYKEKLSVGRFHMNVISPVGEVTGNENTDSIEMLASYHDSAGNSLNALFTGDAEEDRTGEALRRGDVGDIDFLKVGHHGSARSITSAQVHVLKPEVAVASAGKNNKFGHPKPQCVATLEESGSAFYCTKDDGDVTVEPGRDGPRVRTQHKHR